ncbi:MAG: hypothetical protein FWD58_05590 [Firmicutes bacterium]|nr:hypothetical protein [Bacillota bacterium]
MQFEKKLIILSGSADAKGTLSLERNAYGLFAVLCVYHLPDIKRGEYRVGIKTEEKAFIHNVGSFGRIIARFRLEMPDGRDVGGMAEPLNLARVHCVVFETEQEIPLLYGTSAVQKLWAGNMMDGLRSKKSEPQKEIVKTPNPSPLPAYSGRRGEIRNYFFDIKPGERIEVPAELPGYLTDIADHAESIEGGGVSGDPVTGHAPGNPVAAVQDPAREAEDLLANVRAILGDYNDQALAEVNYFVKTPIYSTLSAVRPSDTLNPVDRYLLEEERGQGSGDRDQEVGIRSEELGMADGLDTFIPVGGDPLGVPPEPICRGSGRGELGVRSEESRMNDMESKTQGTGSKTFEDGGPGDVPPESVGVNLQKVSQYARDYSIQSTACGHEKPNPESRQIGSGGAVQAPLPTGKNVTITNPEPRIPNPELHHPEAAFTVPPASTYHASVSAAAAQPGSVFYEQVKAQLDELFLSCEPFALLEELMPETRWVRVNFDETKFYVVGLIPSALNGGKRPDYICYGVPAEYSPAPPAELGEGSRWLPENPQSPQGKGFWLLFQDAATGEAES